MKNRQTYTGNIGEKMTRTIRWEAIGVLLAVVSAAAAVGAWMQVTQSTSVKLAGEVESLRKRCDDLEGLISRAKLDCQSIESKGQVAVCPEGFIVTGCSAGRNKGSITYERSFCRTQEEVDWTSARCCRVGGS